MVVAKKILIVTLLTVPSIYLGSRVTARPEFPPPSSDKINSNTKKKTGPHALSGQALVADGIGNSKWGNVEGVFVSSNMVAFGTPLSPEAAGKALLSNGSGGVSWSNLPTTAMPIGAAGGDLTGAYPSPTIAASAITAAKIADGAVTSAKIAPLPKAFIFRGVSAQTIPSGVGTIIAFNAKVYDIGNLSNIVNPNSRLTCTEAGVYQVGAKLTWEGNGSGGVRSASILLNGGEAAADVRSADGFGIAVTINTHMMLNVGDYVELSVFQTSGGSLSAASTALWMSKLP